MLRHIFASTKSRGMTLIELIVVITMLAILLGLSVLALNPRKQINKVDDAARKKDIQTIKTALDTYYNDHNCYPTTLPFGGTWQENNTVYLREVPQDIACAGNKNCYVYKYSGTCSQWSVVFAKLAVTPSTSQCSLTQHSACVPSDYDSSWACIVSGDVDAAGCAHLSASALSQGSDSSSGSGSGSGSGAGSGSGSGSGSFCSRDYLCSNGTCNHTTTNAGTYCTSTCDGFCAGR